MRGEIKIEVLNITNTVEGRAVPNRDASAARTFGQIRTQSGFMRLTQLSSG